MYDEFLSRISLASSMSSAVFVLFESESESDDPWGGLEVWWELDPAPALAVPTPAPALATPAPARPLSPSASNFFFVVPPCFGFRLVPLVFLLVQTTVPYLLPGGVDNTCYTVPCGRTEWKNG